MNTYSNNLKIVIINNTLRDQHYGCYVTMNNIFKALEKFGGECILSLDVGMYSQIYKPQRELIRESDFILLNGEGTLHHANSRAVSCAQTGVLMKFLYGKPVYLINATYILNSRYMHDCLSYYDMIFVRDRFSQQHLKEHGIYSETMPDMTFYSNYDAITSKKKPYIACIGSVLEDVRNKIFLLEGENFKSFPICFTDEHFENYIRNLKGSRGILSGRFHGVCFAIQTGTPFLAVESNTPKILALLTELNMTNRLITLDDIDENMTIPEFTQDEKATLNNYKRSSCQKIDSVFYKIFDHFSKRYG